MEQPLVSVVIPFYSNVEWLNEAIESVLNQTYKNMEVLVINDGSKEDLVNGLYNYKDQIYIINKENGGPSSARNFGIEKSNGKYVAFLDSDDIWLPEKLENQISGMENNGFLWSQHSYQMFWEDSNKTKIIDTSCYENDVYINTFISFKIQTSCVVVLRDMLMRNNIRFPNRRYGQDGAFYKEIAKKYPIGYIQGIYSKFRIRGSNAGFRARVQIDSKALVWNDIKNNQSLLDRLPKPIIISYKLLNVFNKCINVLDKKIIKKDNVVEFLSKGMYFFPYLTFKFYSKRV